MTIAVMGVADVADRVSELAEDRLADIPLLGVLSHTSAASLHGLGDSG